MANYPMLLGTYDPGAVVITLSGPTGKIEFVGWDEGEFFSLERTSEFFNNKVGVMGEVSRAYIRDASCRFTVRLQSTSPTIKAMEDLKVATSALKVPPVMVLTVTDPSSYETLAVAQCWIQKDPVRAYGAEVGVREYEFYGVATVTASNNNINIAANTASILV